MALLKLSAGWNRVKPVHELGQGEDGFVQCSVLRNFIVRDNKIRKIGGTEAYNSSLGNNPITWVHRSYHKRADGSVRKVVFCFFNGDIYYGDDVAGTLTQTQGAFTSTAIPLHATMQVSGNAILYIFIGETLNDIVYKYDGNGSFTFEKTTINADMGRVVEGAVVHLDRMWYWSRKSSIIN